MNERRRFANRRASDRSSLSVLHDARYKDAREAAFISGAVLFALISTIIFR